MTGPRKSFFLVLVGWLAAGIGCLPVATAQSAQAPWSVAAEGERLVYKLLWPSGIPLGEAVMEVSSAGGELRLEATVEAQLPQHNVSYRFSSVATEEDLCSRRFHQKIAEGSRRWEETIEFDQDNHQARRRREEQETTAPVPPCARDPLAFLYYFRRQLAQGNPLRSGAFHLGTNYDVGIAPAGSEPAPFAEPNRAGEKFVVTYRGPGSENTLELWVGSDSARAPFAVRLPSSLGVFSAVLQ